MAQIRTLVADRTVPARPLPHLPECRLREVSARHPPRQRAPALSHVCLFGHFQSVVYLNAQVPNRALYLAVA